MDVHEYQAKEILASHHVAVPPGTVAFSPDQAVYAATELGGSHWVVKAQIHAGARGKAGGIKLCRTYHEVQQAARDLLGKRLVTGQTGPEGKPVQRVYVELADPYERELYLGYVLDRKLERVRVIASKHGGMEIEEIAKNTPDEIIQVIVEPAVGLQPFQAREIAFQLGLNIKQVSRAVQSIMGAYRAFRDNDATMLEINPLVVTKTGELVCLDAKIGFDDNALYRHPDIAALRDPTEEDAKEIEASRYDLNYVALDGTIGCMVNGAGLAMATMDIIKLYGEEPANFLDVGGGASREKVTAAFKIIVSDPHVKGILVNICGGIMKCDIIAEGIVAAAREISLSVPLVVRLEGTNVEKGKEILAKSGLPIVSGSDLADAAQKIVKAVKR